MLTLASDHSYATSSNISCAPKSHWRYERIYWDHLGYSTVIVAIPPRLARGQGSRRRVRDFRDGPVLDVVGSRHWFFHGFSNGVFFLWEAVLYDLRARL